MKVGIIYPQIELGGDPDAVRSIGTAVEELGFDHLLVYDHVVGASHDREPKLTGPYTENDPFHDPFVMLGHLAAITERIELVTGVLILPQRQTVLVARQAADVDLLSGERLRLGIGIGWNYVEYDVLGEDFSKRGKRYSDQIEVLRKLWNEPLVAYDSDFHSIDRVALNPRPKRSVPLWMGGYSEAALRRAARVGDGFIFADGLGDAFGKAPELIGYLEEQGRSVGPEFGLQCNTLKAKDPGDAVETTQRWQDIGGTHVAVNTMGKGFDTTAKHIDYIEQVADAMRDAGFLA